MVFTSLQSLLEFQSFISARSKIVKIHPESWSILLIRLFCFTIDTDRQEIKRTRLNDIAAAAAAAAAAE